MCVAIRTRDRVNAPFLILEYRDLSMRLGKNSVFHVILNVTIRGAVNDAERTIAYVQRFAND